jgi:hypothetical protein
LIEFDLWLVLLSLLLLITLLSLSHLFTISTTTVFRLLKPNDFSKSGLILLNNDLVAVFTADAVFDFESAFFLGSSLPSFC